MEKKNRKSVYQLYVKMRDPFKKYGRVLCISLDNDDYISELRLNNDVTVVSEKYNISVDFGIDYVFRNENDLKGYLKDMKFDCIIMNPPYSKNLHLKILAEAIKHLKDENSTCVNLSPICKLQTAWRRGKVAKELTFLNTCTANVEAIECDDAVALFELGNCGTDLGIWTCSAKNSTNIFELGKSLTSNAVFIDKMKKFVSGMPTMIDYLVDADDVKKHKLFIKFVDGLSLKNNGGHGKSSYAAVSINFATATKFTPGNHCKYVLLNNEVERLNFWKIYTSDVIRFMYMTLMGAGTEYELLPWLGDAVNPRTGLKGYQGEWTDEDLYTFFSITDDEKKVIEETMAKYK